MTRLHSGTSIPSSATDVAIKRRTSPLRNLSTHSSCWACVIPEIKENKNVTGQKVKNVTESCKLKIHYVRPTAWGIKSSSTPVPHAT